jgi:hypothetical protein
MLVQGVIKYNIVCLGGLLDAAIRIKQELRKIKILFRLFVLLNFVNAFNFYAAGGSDVLGTVFHLVFLSIFFFLYNKTFIKLNYSFWTFSFLYLIYYFVRLLGLFEATSLYGIILVVKMLLFVAICYSINSPLYYPRVRWWEYDFRYKGDLKIEVYKGGEVREGRLYDLRRDAGCLTLFEKIETGEKILVKLILDGQIYEFHVQVVTAKSNSIGRGYVHGVRFSLKDHEERRKYNRLTKKWRILVKKRIREKFNESDS